MAFCTEVITTERALAIAETTSVSGPPMPCPRWWQWLTIGASQWWWRTYQSARFLKSNSLLCGEQCGWCPLLALACDNMVVLVVLRQSQTYSTVLLHTSVLIVIKDLARFYIPLGCNPADTYMRNIPSTLCAYN